MRWVPECTLPETLHETTRRLRGEREARSLVTRLCYRCKLRGSDACCTRSRGPLTTSAAGDTASQERRRRRRGGKRGELHADRRGVRRGDGAHQDGRRRQGGDLPAEQYGKKTLSTTAQVCPRSTATTTMRRWIRRRPVAGSNAPGVRVHAPQTGGAVDNVSHGDVAPHKRAVVNANGADSTRVVGSDKL